MRSPSYSSSRAARAHRVLKLVCEAKVAKKQKKFNKDQREIFI